MDRDYWRSAPIKRLIEEARGSGHELCIALGERLEEADDEIAEEADKWENISIENDDTISQLHERIGEVEHERDVAEEEVSTASSLLARIELIVSGNARSPAPTLEDLLPEVSAWLNKIDGIEGEDEDGDRP